LKQFRKFEELQMNAQQWRAEGFKVFFLNSTVYLYKQDQPAIAYKLQNHQGGWMRYNDLSDWEKITLSASQVEDFQYRNLLCYCGSGGVHLCDFCASRRRAASANFSLAKGQLSEV